MAVCLGKLSQAKAIVVSRFANSDSKAAKAFADICLDVHNPFNLFQIAPDRGGTTPSRHVRDFKRDQGVV